MDKPLDITSKETAEESVDDIQTFGDPYSWVLICKASSAKQKWMKSTKAYDIGCGCLVQTSTQVGDHIADALAFVPGVRIEDGKLVPISTGYMKFPPGVR